MELQFVSVEEFEKMWDRVERCMKRYADGKGFLEYQDYNVYWPYNGWSQVLVEVFNLKILSGRLVEKLRRQVNGCPGWEIVVAIDIKEHWNEWPRMGLRIHAQEVINDLRREYLPAEFRSLTFFKSRPSALGDQ